MNNLYASRERAKCCVGPCDILVMGFQCSSPCTMIINMDPCESEKEERVQQFFASVTCFAYCQLWFCKKLLRCPKPYFLFDTFVETGSDLLPLFSSFLFLWTLFLSFSLFFFHFIIHAHAQAYIHLYILRTHPHLFLHFHPPPPLQQSPLKQGVTSCALIATSSINLSFVYTLLLRPSFLSVFAAHSPLFLYTSPCALFVYCACLCGVSRNCICVFLVGVNPATCNQHNV